MTTMPAADAWATVPADAPAPSAETTAVSDAGPRLLAMTTERPARRAVRAIACPSRPAPMIPTRLRSAGSIRFLPRARGRSAFPAGCDVDRRMDDRQPERLGCLHRRLVAVRLQFGQHVRPMYPVAPVSAAFIAGTASRPRSSEQRKCWSGMERCAGPEVQAH